MATPLIAIVGRPNVGKSTFFNRLLKQRKAIVDPQEGITRDRVYGITEWTGHTLQFVDTGGYIPVDEDAFTAAVREQARQAIDEADLVLFMVDGREDPTASDKTLAQFVRKSGKKLIVAVNKCDTLESEERINAFHEFGLEPLIPFSALTGRLTGDLLDEIVAKLNLTFDPQDEEPHQDLRLAIVGMPNVGKSSLANALLRKENSIVTNVPGTTRDAVDSNLKWHGKDITLIDTAGLRKKSKAMDNIEFYSTVRSRRSIQACDVALMMIDGNKAFGKQDKSIANLIIKSGKGMVLIVNKWDLVEKDSATLSEYEKEMRYQYRELAHFPILFISAKTKQRISAVLEAADGVHEARNQSISTSKLNAFLNSATRELNPPAVKGKNIKIKYMTQVHYGPPIFALFTNYPNLMPITYKRYLENKLRKSFGFKGVPIKLTFRKK
ncbi:MAG: ribosome biogenesis GTPase Der [Candidatus Marinimicrobia bacterium]|jgi:GTP-binding protein|nr:ribosome biogenesis GTPase Der [Candidatus Neomarinimicrobiota bacterium]MBT3617312.1 ribosome biogenesis GTPase Der [Candidatus Neomarinimicrobiota bacterium]MBT3828875.1 ribosome biogenesis GTPase Der [Candidatus Neomarinimicrobiota bacterium]MBT3996700.1 ribosome biogenesis GTPase Der [Candidatus Neomarinimicrobiota bacterium]MBT4281325.1 ribosome biogenesis GTPase Der [Candidatus Neomarinimicrobiota bacterium]